MNTSDRRSVGESDGIRYLDYPSDLSKLTSPQEHGIVVVRGLDAIDLSEWVDAFQRLARRYGSLQPQDATGTILREVRNRGVLPGQGASARYSDSAAGGNYHTDGVPSPAPLPDLFGLLCVRQAPVGGSLILIDTASAVSHLARAAPATLRLLSRSFHFDSRGFVPEDEGGTVRRPIIDGNDDDPTISYLRAYIEAAHSRPQIPDLTDAEVDAFDQLDAVLENRHMQIWLKLQPGEMVFVDNRRYLHGREPFQDGPDEASGRLMYRLWISYDRAHR